MEVMDAHTCSTTAVRESPALIPICKMRVSGCGVQQGGTV